MAKVAKIVVASFMTRVIVDENARYEDIVAAAKPRIAETVQTEFGENVEDVFDDKEMPYDPDTDEK